MVCGGEITFEDHLPLVASVVYAFNRVVSSKSILVLSTACIFWFFGVSQYMRFNETSLKSR